MSSSTSTVKDDHVAVAAGEAALERAPANAQASMWRWVIAVVMLLTIVTGFFDRISIAVLFTDKNFNATLGTAFKPAVLGLLMSSFLLAYAISALFLSFVGDLLGPRRALGAATALWGGMMLLMGSCSSYALMLVLRVVLGLSEGPQFSFVSKTIHRWFPPHERGRANAIWMVGSPLGSAIGFPLTIWLVANYGWRASFFCFAFLNICVITPLIFSVVRDLPSEAASGPGTELVAKQRMTLADLRTMLTDRNVWMLSLYGTGLLTYIWGLNSWLPTYFERERHFNIHQMGIYSSLPFILMFFAEMASGLIADRTGRRALLSVAGLFGAGILLLIGTRVEDPHIAAIVIAFSAASWGFGVPAQYALAMRVLPPTATATGIGIINGIGNLVGACAPAAIGFVVAQTGTFQSGLLVVVAMSLFGALSMVPMLKSH